MPTRTERTQYKLNLPTSLYGKIVASAYANGRSIAGEITYQLTRAYTPVLVGPYFGPQQPGWPNRDEERMDRMAGNS